MVAAWRLAFNIYDNCGLVQISSNIEERKPAQRMSQSNDFSMFADLDFEDFKRMASNPSLSRHQKVGFPDSYREGKEEVIFADIRKKLKSLNKVAKNVLEIGPGCSRLPEFLCDLCKETHSHLYLVDSQEMLDHLPDEEHISKIPGRFPDALSTKNVHIVGNIDVIIAYSVLQYVFAEGNIFGFVDNCLRLLADGGEILLGDIPNISMRKRFFSSESGINLHKEFTGKDEMPTIIFNKLELNHIDDSIIVSILMRARSQGYHAWVVPQEPALPMANRREDILIRKP
jgi:hypothetical protein